MLQSPGAELAEKEDVGRGLEKESLPDRQCVGRFQILYTYDTQEDMWPTRLPVLTSKRTCWSVLHIVKENIILWIKQMNICETLPTVRGM